MPQTHVVAYKKSSGARPVIDWLLDMRQFNEEVFVAAAEAILELEKKGYELERPTSGTLDQGINELRIKVNRTQYRILYFFMNSRKDACLTHAFTKKTKKVPKEEIKRAVRHRDEVQSDPKKHTAEME